MAISPQQAAAKGKGWVDANNPNYGKPGFVGPEDEDGAAPATPSAQPPPSDPNRIATPSLGPLVDNGGTATHAPTGTPPAPPPDRIAGPSLGPLVADPTTGQATHQPGALPAVPDRVPGTLSIDPAGGTAAPPATPLPAVPGPVSTDPAAAAPAAAASPVNTALKDALLKMLGQGDPSLNDPALKAQADAYGFGQQRARQHAQEALTERLAGQGLSDSGAADRGMLGLFEQQGQNEGAFNASLVGNELQQRRQQLLSAAALAGNQLDAESRLALQKEIAQNDADIRRASLAQQGSQFTQSQAQQGQQFQQTLAQSSKQWGQQYGLEGQKLAETVRQFDTTTQAGRDALKQQLEMFKQSQAQQGKQFDVDAELKKLGITQQGQLGQSDIDLRRILGEGNLNLGLLSALFQNQQFGQGLGAQLGMFNSGQSNNFLQSLLAALGQAA